VKVDDDGNELHKPAAFTAVRDAAKTARDKAKEEKAQAELSDDDKARASLREILDAISERIDALEGDTLSAVAIILQDTAKQIDKAA
jgi:hypothetical protein